MRVIRQSRLAFLDHPVNGFLVKKKLRIHDVTENVSDDLNITIDVRTCNIFVLYCKRRVNPLWAHEKLKTVQRRTIIHKYGYWYTRR